MKLISLEDFLKAAVPPAFIVDGILPERSIFLLSGEPYSGKSLLALDLALAVASGQKFLGRQARLGKVVFLGKDSPRWDYAQQAKKLCNGRCIGPHDADDFWFGQLEFERPLHSDEGATQLIQMLHSVHADVVVMDSLRKMHLWEENSSGQMTPVMDRVRLIADSGIAVVLVHHKAKPREGQQGNYEARGSGVISSEADVHWLLEKRVLDDGSPELRCTVGKARAGALEGLVKIGLHRTMGDELVRLDLLSIGPPELPEPPKRPRGRPRKSSA